MKKIIIALVIVMLLISTVSAAEGNVTYSGDAGDLIFAPGSEYSPTDLFPDLKDVMPGDTLTQKITVKNDASNQVKVKIYMRALGAHEDSVDFLSQLKLRVEKTEDNMMGYMFDAYANETAQLTDWVCLGMLYSGGEVNLDVTLEVPVTLDNTFKEKVGYLDWEFRIIEYPVEDTDPQPPKTGDDTNLVLLIAVMALCAAAIVVLLILKKKGRGDDE